MNNIFVKTRQEAEIQMKIGNTFTATTWRNISSYNKKILKFYMSKYNYKMSKLERGIDLYELSIAI